MPLIHTILIANRGEIAARIVRTCRSLGIRSVAVYSDADRHAPFVEAADVAIPLGGNSPADTYLNADKVLAATLQTRANAIHPGYGFLAENAEFAQRCRDDGLIFIGPRPEAIAAMGSKSEAKALMEKHGVPVVPGNLSTSTSFEYEAERIGYPVLLKAVAGGGGKGMRIVEDADHLEGAVAEAKSEAMSAFGNDELILEKYFSSVRHIEFQIFGDQNGHAIHLLERECTIQRRYQKIIEESPSPALSPELREKMGQAAVNAALALQYDNAGTVEFILDENDNFYFLEINTRLQVEHPVTEMITGLDLVAMQIQVAEGADLPLAQSGVVGKGYAIECRLYAEDAEKNFMPSTGKLLAWAFPNVEGLRIDSGVKKGSEVSVWYDPMLAKIIVHAATRAEAMRKMQYVLQEMHCPGPVTNREFLLDLLQDEAVQQGHYNTHFLAKRTYKRGKNRDLRNRCLIAATMQYWQNRQNNRGVLASVPSGWRNSYFQDQEVDYEADGEEIKLKYRVAEQGWEVELEGAKIRANFIGLAEGAVELESGASQSGGLRGKVLLARDVKGLIHAQCDGREFRFRQLDRFPAPGALKAEGGYRAPMPSQVLKVLVTAGDSVQAGTPLLVLSSMKMENTIAAESDGTVLEVLVKAGSNIEADTELLTFQKADEA